MIYARRDIKFDSHYSSTECAANSKFCLNATLEQSRNKIYSMIYCLIYLTVSRQVDIKELIFWWNIWMELSIWDAGHTQIMHTQKHLKVTKDSNGFPFPWRNTKETTAEKRNRSGSRFIKHGSIDLSMQINRVKEWHMTVKCRMQLSGCFMTIPRSYNLDDDINKQENIKYKRPPWQKSYTFKHFNQREET